MPTRTYGLGSLILLAQTIAALGCAPRIRQARVQSVLYGAEVLLESGERVRYIGIDTMKTELPKLGEDYFGREAEVANRSLVEGKTVRLEFDRQRRDARGRLLAYVYAGTTFVNLELVRTGVARAGAYPPNLKHQRELEVAQAEAQAAHAGMWGSTKRLAVESVAGGVMESFEAEVTRVVTGDAVLLSDGRRLKLIGLRSPKFEGIPPGQADRPYYGEEALKGLRRWVEGQRVVIGTDHQRADLDGSLLGYVWVRETFVNAELLREGLVYMNSVLPNVRFEDEFARMEDEAKAAGRGLWAVRPP